MKVEDIKGRMLIKRYPNWSVEEIKMVEKSPSSKYVKIQRMNGDLSWENQREYANWKLIERL